MEAKLARDADQLDLIFELKEHQDLGNSYAPKWIAAAYKRLTTPLARKLADQACETDWTSWWFYGGGSMVGSRRKNSGGIMSRITKTVMLAGLIVVFLVAPSMAAFFSNGDNDNDPVKMDSQTVVKLAEKLKPAVVNIDTESTVSVGNFGTRNMPKDFRDFFERFFGQMPDNQQQQQRKRQGTGSGFLITKDGYIVTNNHVVENAEKITVRTLDKKIYEAKVVGQDPKTDVALIKVEADDLPFAELGDSDVLKVGEWVLAIGNPFGLDHTVTAGIVSAKGRVIGAGPYDDFIQTDAAINFGNSGGPLFDFHGRVVGMNTAIIARGQGIGFAVPVNVIKDIVSQLRDKGKVTRAELGVLIQPITDELAESFGLKEKRRRHRQPSPARFARGKGRDQAGRRDHRVQRRAGGQLPRPAQDGQHPARGLQEQGQNRQGRRDHDSDGQARRAEGPHGPSPRRRSRRNPRTRPSWG